MRITKNEKINWEKLKKDIEKIFFNNNFEKHINGKELIPLFKKYDFDYTKTRWKTRFYEIIKNFRKDIRKNKWKKEEIFYIVSGRVLAKHLKVKLSEVKNEKMSGYFVTKNKELIKEYLEQQHKQAISGENGSGTILNDFNELIEKIK